MWGATVAAGFWCCRAVITRLVHKMHLQILKMLLTGWTSHWMSNWITSWLLEWLSYWMINRPTNLLLIYWYWLSDKITLTDLLLYFLHPAFNTATGMPYGTVNLLHGVPEGETPVTCTAGVGTYILEFGTLTKLTGWFLKYINMFSILYPL
jgi:hypothetical protein